MCEHGQGTKRDLGEAVRLYRAAAAQRDVRALARLGVCLEKGRGVEQSEAEAATSYAASSELGGADVLFEFSMQYLDAVGKMSAPESFTLQLAVSELVLAARLGHVGAVEDLASISSRRELVSICCLGCGATRELRLCSRCRVAAFCDGDSIIHLFCHPRRKTSTQARVTPIRKGCNNRGEWEREIISELSSGATARASYLNKAPCSSSQSGSRQQALALRHAPLSNVYSSSCPSAYHSC